MTETVPASVTHAQLRVALLHYPHRVTGPYAGCRHPEAVPRYALAQPGPVSRLALNYVRTLHGGCWNAMAAILDADGWIRWYAGDGRPA